MSLGTILLAVIAPLSAYLAFRQVASTRKIAAEEASYTKKIAAETASRRRAESTFRALNRAFDSIDGSQSKLLSIVRSMNEGRDRPNYYTISELLSRKSLRSEVASLEFREIAVEILNSLENLSVGVELRVYDEYVIYHISGERILEFYKRNADFIEFCRQGHMHDGVPQSGVYRSFDNLIEVFAKIKRQDAPSRLAGALEDLPD